MIIMIILWLWILIYHLSLIIHIYIFILSNTYPALELDKDMVKVSMTNMQCSLLIIHCKSLPSGKNIKNYT